MHINSIFEINHGVSCSCFPFATIMSLEFKSTDLEGGYDPPVGGGLAPLKIIIIKK